MVNTSFSAVIIRYVPDVLAGEFLNVGVVLLCPARSYVGTRFAPSWERLAAAFPKADIGYVQRTVARIAESVEVECEAYARHNGVPSDVTKVMAVSSPLAVDGSLQASPVIRGITDSPTTTLDDLHHRYVEAGARTTPTTPRIVKLRGRVIDANLYIKPWVHVTLATHEKIWHLIATGPCASAAQSLIDKGKVVTAVLVADDARILWIRLTADPTPIPTVEETAARANRDWGDTLRALATVEIEPEDEDNMKGTT